MTRAKVLFPGYRFGPNGECRLFQTEADVPDGWTRIHPDNRPEVTKPTPVARKAPAAKRVK